jgi:Ca2+-binding RTX toxin-like protein
MASCRRYERDRRAWSLIGRTFIAAALTLAILAAPAGAASVSKLGLSTIVYEAAPTEVNDLTVSRVGANYQFTEAGSVTVFGLCEVPSIGSSALCGAAGVTQIRILLDDGGDQMTIDPSVAAAGQPTILAEGGTGDDTLNGGDGPESLCGGPGDDTLNGGGGNDRLDFPCVDPAVDQTSGADTLSGGPGDDQLNGGPAGVPLEGDTLFGADGTDTAYYDQRVAPLTITLDGAANDGEAGEGDDVAPDVENVIGGSAGDTLVGGAPANMLDGRDGNDTVTGGAGDDTVLGANGNDTVSGGDGNDAVTGADGDDHLLGDQGADDLTGGGGADTLDGGADGDTLAGGPGIDIVNGGDGNDQLYGAEPGLVGGDGGDTLNGGAGADALHGGPGDDGLDGGPGADAINGDDGEDTLTYRARTNDVTVTLDGKPNDGEPREGDNVAGDVEIVIGGTLDDTLMGNGSANTFQAGLGEDYLQGNAGVDDLEAGAGSDLIWARDGVHDTVDCGGGGDLAVVDRNDDTRNCRWLDRTGSRKPVVGRFALVRGANFGYGTPVGKREYEDLAGSLKIPTGSKIDAEKTVRVTIASTANGGRQDTSLSGGPFWVALGRRATVYKFAVGPRRCSRSGPRAAADARAPRIVVRTQRKRNKQRTVVQGDHSDASSGGTAWITEERCSGTFTRVLSGVVRVRDLRLKKTVVVRAPGTYLARAR